MREIKLRTEQWSIKKREAFMDNWRMVHGLPPHNNISNICYGDGYFMNSLIQRYEMTEEEMSQAFKSIEDGRAITEERKAVAA